MAVALPMLLSGCGDERIDTTYGRRSGIIGKDSVNGTAVLAGLFSRAGHRVVTKHMLTNALMEKAEAIGAGFDAIESKPVNIQSLLGVIRKYIERKPLSETT